MRRNYDCSKHNCGLAFRKVTTGLFLLQIVISALTFSGCDNDSPIEPEHPTGGPILFISNKSGTYQLYSMNDDGTEISQMTNDDTFPIQDARYSPDGNRVVVSSDVGGYGVYGPALYVMCLDGTSRKKLTNPRPGRPEYASGCRPTWERKGERIAFSRLSAPESRGNYNIFVVSSDGSNETQLTSTADTSEYLGAWTPDGLGIVSTISTYGGGSTLQFARLALFDLSGSIRNSWFLPGHSCSSPVVSPSGLEIAFCSSDGSGTQDIFVVRSDSTLPIQKVSDGKNVYVTPVSWHSDGERVVFNAGGNDPLGRSWGKILVVNARTREIIDITPFKDTNAYCYATSRR